MHLSEELWTKPITADGATATPEQLQKAWRDWQFHTRTATALCVRLTKAGVTGPTARVADRMLQRARKAGVVRYVKGRWVNS